MHREFRERLATARGDHRFVIAVFLDVRNFSAYFADSAESALYLRKAYRRILDDYFAEASFFKPTGDGLMVIIEIEDANYKEKAKAVLEASLKLESTFPTLLADDAFLNFRKPDRLGIGLARGTSSRLFSGDVTLDYSGRTLNIAARLLDLARPRGIVVERDFGVDGLDAATQEQFEPAEVYLRGVSPKVPVPVLYLSGKTEIARSNLSPLDEEQWAQSTITYTVEELGGIGTTLLMPLTTRPSDPGKIKLVADYMKRMLPGGKRRTMGTIRRDGAEHREGTKTFARINVPEIVRELRKDGIPPETEVTLVVWYPV